MNNHGFGIRNEQGIANLEQRKMQASVKKQKEEKNNARKNSANR